MAYSDNNSYEEILRRALNNSRLVDIDKREGSVIYDTLAPLCLELAEVYIKLDMISEQSSILTATGTYLDTKVSDFGIIREEATKALRTGTFKKYKRDENNKIVIDDQGNKVLEDMVIPLNSRFLVPENNNIIYKYIRDEDDVHILECESAGVGGNEYIGVILPITPIQNLVEARLTSIIRVPAQDRETDNELRIRAREIINYQSFGGNIADYREKVGSINGVGRLKVFPAFEQRGGVLLSVVSSDFHAISEEFKVELKNVIDDSIAPIGHNVTVTTPNEVDITVDLAITVDLNYTISSIRDEIEEVIRGYIDEKRKEFAKTNDSNIQLYGASVIDRVMNITGIVDVEDVRFNGEQTWTSNDVARVDGQNIPVLYEVIING